MGKLTGIRVIDCSLFFPGPMMTVMMADQGAEVIKVEPPQGDPVRQMAPFENGQSVWFRNLNRGKQSRRINLKTEAGKSELWELIEGADVFVEGFRPGVMAKLGFAPELVAQRAPRVVYCSISAFGQTGALAHHPAHDIVVQALTGFMSVNDGSDGTPVVPGVPSADMAGGLTALSAVLMALIGREKTGKGDYLDIAMFDALLPWCVHIAGDALAGEAPPNSATHRSLGGAALYQIYETADKRHIALGGREPKFAHHLLTALNRADLILSTQSDAGPGQRPVIEFLRETFATKTRDDWTAWFKDKDIAFAPILDFAEALRQPHMAERGLLVEKDGAHHLAPAIRFTDEAWSPATSPELGG